MSAITSAGTPRRGERFIDLSKDPSGAVKQDRASLGHLNAARRSFEERNAEFFFKRAQLLAKRRLRDAKPFGSPRHRSRFRDSGEISKVAELDRRYPLSISQLHAPCIGTS
jgi:hypothetical protein